MLVPDSQDGLPDSETTMAAMLKPLGYGTACVGKWHLGSRRQYLPTNRGFDEYFGILTATTLWPPSLVSNTTS